MGVVEVMLNNYRVNKTDLELKEIKLEGLKKQLEYNNSSFEESETDVIEGISMPATIVTDIPKSVTNKFSSSTENAAIQYRNDLLHFNETDIIEVKQQIAVLSNEIYILKNDIKKVDTLINSLLFPKEKFVIIHRFINNYNINEIATLFFKEFNYGSKGTVIGLLNEALKKMENRLKHCA